MTIDILSSGSNGNSTLITIGEKSVLLDCGISYKKLNEKLQNIDFIFEKVDYVFVSHEHVDHIRGLEQVIKKWNPKIVCSQKTYEQLSKKYEINNIHIAMSGKKILLNNVIITPLELSHDAKEPLMYVFEEGNSKFWYIHDTGYIPSKYFNILRNPSIMIIESNYDIDMLLNSSSYPHYTKMRIHSDIGHLSNNQAYEYIMNLIGPKTEEIIIAHISENNNSIAKIKEILNNIDKLKISFTEQNKIMERREINDK